MEYLEGESLADRLQKGALPVRQTLQIGVETGERFFSCLMSGAIVTGFYLWQRNFHRLNLCPPSHRLHGNLDQSAGDTASLRVPLVELSRKRPDLCRVAGNGAVLPEFFCLDDFSRSGRQFRRRTGNYSAGC